MASVKVYSTLLFVLILISTPFTMKAQNVYGEFSRETLCFLQDRLKFEYSRSVPDQGGNAKTCARLCGLETDCVGFSVKRGSHNLSSMITNSSQQIIIEPEREINCYLHKEFLTNEECVGDNVEMDHTFYRKRRACANGGVWSDEKQECACVGEESKPDIKVGKMCTATPRNCRDVSNYGLRPITGYVHLKPWPHYHAKTILVLCTISEDGETRVRISMNARTTTGFNKAWADYEKEFGAATYYWIGLDVLYNLILTTAEPTTVYTEVTCFRGNPPCAGGSKLYDVKITGKMDGYRLTYSDLDLSGSFLESPERFCWQYSNNTKFSTFDMDNDENEAENCAALNGVGWWFGPNCTSPCNLLGSQYWYNAKLRFLTPSYYSLGQIRVPGMNGFQFATDFTHALIEIHA